MGAFASQHFVPKCYLRRFSSDHNRRIINIYDKYKKEFFYKAPIKSQCAKNYFYGEDLTIEHYLQSLESQYGAIASRVAAGLTLSAEDFSFLNKFTYLQYMRTSHASTRRMQVMESMYDLTQAPVPEEHREVLNDTEKESVSHLLYIWMKDHDRLGDLESIVLKNNTRDKFFSSDDPAVITNRLLMQRFNDDSFGMISSGLIMMMPMDPFHLFVAYDPDVYRFASGKGISNKRDVSLINSFQLLKCDRLIYFDDLKLEAEISRLAEECAPYSPSTLSNFWVGVKIAETEDFEEFRKASEEEIASPIPKLMSFSPRFPRPSGWPSFLQYRRKPIGYSNGAAVGPVRKSEAVSRGGQWRQDELTYRAPGVRGPVALRDQMFLRKQTRDQG